jgi:hypothetical protein
VRRWRRETWRAEWRKDRATRSGSSGGASTAWPTAWPRRCRSWRQSAAGPGGAPGEARPGGQRVARAAHTGGVDPRPHRVAVDARAGCHCRSGAPRRSTWSTARRST